MAYENDDDSGFDKPVEEGKTYTVTIDDLGSKGDGIARVEGFVVFVPETEVGETVEVEVNSVGRKFAFAEVVSRDADPEEAENVGQEEEPAEELDEDVDEVDDVEEVEEVEEVDEVEEEEDDERYDKEHVEEEEDLDAAGDFEDQFDDEHGF